MTQANTLIDLVRRDAAAEHELSFFTGAGAPYRSLDALTLGRRARGRLAVLQAAGLGADDEVVMPIADPAEFLETFWACLQGGIVPMPLAPPSNDASCSKVIDILISRGDARLVCGDDEFARLVAHAGESGAARDLEARRLVVGAEAADGPEGEAVERSAEDLAFVQYSSGSTRAPKGVIIRHGQALANLEAIRQGAGLGPADRTLSWMPLSHDMGLVGFHLSPLYAGAASQAIMPTSAFARSPLLWLQDATRLGATILSSPNFGYRHVLKAAARKGVPDGVDLAAVRLVMNGAEPISVELADEFIEALAGSAAAPRGDVPGLRPRRSDPGRDLPGPRRDHRRGARRAELLGLGDAVEVTDDAASLVTCGLGAPLPGLELRIAGEDGGALADGHVGRIWIRGAGVTEGYHDDVAATSAAVQGEGWLDTGDLGFVQGGGLHVTGRLKDLVIVDGQNFYPHDLEESLQRALQIDALRVAVAPVRPAGGAEEIGVFVQHRGEPEAFADTAAAVRKHLSGTYGVGVEFVVPVAQIPRTTSGKVQRVRLAESLLAGEFDAALAILAPDRVRPAAPAREQETASGDEGTPKLWRR